VNSTERAARDALPARRPLCPPLSLGPLSGPLTSLPHAPDSRLDFRFPLFLQMRLMNAALETVIVRRERAVP
jgi:hypothetical protein